MCRWMNHWSVRFLVGLGLGAALFLLGGLTACLLTSVILLMGQLTYCCGRNDEWSRYCILPPQRGEPMLMRLPDVALPAYSTSFSLAYWDVMVVGQSLSADKPESDANEFGVSWRMYRTGLPLLEALRTASAISSYSHANLATLVVLSDGEHWVAQTAILVPSDENYDTSPARDRLNVA